MGPHTMNWLINILLTVLTAIALLCLVKLGFNFWTLGWY